MSYIYIYICIYIYIYIYMSHMLYMSYIASPPLSVIILKVFLGTAISFWSIVDNWAY